MKDYNEESDTRYSLESDFKYPRNLHNLNNDLPVLPEKIKI